MICIDSPQKYVFRNRMIESAHLVSDLSGPEGTRELCAFADLLGHKMSWIQNPGTWREHFDVMSKTRYETALRAGAKLITRHELVAIFRRKRAAMADVAVDFQRHGYAASALNDSRRPRAAE